MATREVHERQLTLAVNLAANMARVIITDAATRALVIRAVDRIYGDVADEALRDRTVDRACTVLPKLTAELIAMVERARPAPVVAGSDAGGEKIPLVVEKQAVETFLGKTDRFYPFCA